MTQLQLCSKGAGFAVAVAACVGLTTSAFGDGTPTPPGTVITQAQISATVTVTGDTSNETHFLDPGVVAGTDCTAAGSAPDEWYQIQMTGSLSVDIDLCTGTSYDSKVFLLSGGAVIPLGCSDDGCGTVGGPSLLVNQPLTVGNYDLAIDGFGTAPGASGPYSTTLREFQTISCFLDPACVGVDEGEPCDETPLSDTVNGGCNSTPAAFGSITIDGPAVCGTNWGTPVGGVLTRDTDWFAFNVAVAQSVELEVRAETQTACFLIGMSAGGACPTTGFPDGVVAFSADCDATHTLGTGYTLDPGDYVLFVGTGTSGGGGLGDGFPCPDGTTTNNAYQAEIRTALPPCPLDLSGNGAVDFADILLIITGWGPCPGT